MASFDSPQLIYRGHVYTYRSSSSSAPHPLHRAHTVNWRYRVAGEADRAIELPVHHTRALHTVHVNWRYRQLGEV